VDLATGAHLDEVVLSTDSVTVTLRLVVITGYKSDLGEGDKAPVTRSRCATERWFTPPR